MDKRLAYKVFQLTEEGNFSFALQTIATNSTISENDAFTVLNCTATACHNCLPEEKLDEDNLILLLNTVLKHVKELSNPKVLSYCNTIFHVCKYFVDRESFENALKMEFLLTADFLTDSLQANNDIKSVYCSIITILSNSIIKLSQNKHQICAEQLIKLGKIILRGSGLVNSKTAVFTLAKKLMIVFRILQIDTSHLIEFYQYIIEFMNLEGIIENIDIYLTVMESLLTYFVKKSDFRNMRLMMRESRLMFDDDIWINIHSVFDTLLICCPEYTITETSFEKWKANTTAFKTQDSTTYVKVLQIISWSMYYLFDYYETSNAVWCQLPTNTLFKVLTAMELFGNDSKLFPNTKEMCGCETADCFQTKFYNAIQLGISTLKLMRVYWQNHTNCTEGFYLKHLSFIHNFWALVESLKNENCSKWITVWDTTSDLCYNLATELFNQKNPINIYFYECVIKYYVKCDKKDSLNSQAKTLESSLSVVCHQYLKEDNIENTMTFAALGCLLCSKQRHSIFTYWAKCKDAIRKKPEKTHCLEWTLESALEQNKCVVDSSLNITLQNKIDLLCFELRQYKAQYPSKLPMMITFKMLSEITDSESIAKTVIEIFGDGNTAVHDDMNSVFRATIKRLEREINAKDSVCIQLALAVLLYYKYKNALENTAEKNMEAMEKSMMLEKKETIIEGVPKDANDECDIVSAYENLRLNTLTRFLDILDQSLTGLASVAKVATSDFKFVDTAHELAVRIGFEYRIHSFGLKSLQAFETSLLLANLSHTPEKRLLSISCIIENTNMNSNRLETMILQAENLETLLSRSNDKEQHDETLATYYLCKAKAYLYKDNNLAYESCKKVQVLFSKSEGKKDIEYLKAKWLILMYKLTKSCDFEGEEHIREPMTTKLHKAHDIVILNGTKGNNYYKMTPHQKCIFFDTVMELTKTYYLMKLPRDLRCYSKIAITLAQKLVLPLRCVSLLVMLAHADLMCAKFDHCNSKINGINDIFSIPSYEQKLPVFKPSEIQKINEIDDITIDILGEKMQELALDLPKHYRQFSPASPTLRVEGFREPAFLTHEIACLCFFCMCIEQQLLLLEKVRLDALINSYQKQNKIADDCFRGAVRLYQKIKRNFTRFKKKSEIYIPEYSIADIEELYLETYANTLLDYSFHLVRTGLKEEAMKVNMELLEILYPKQIQFIYLYSEALIQRASYLMPSSSVEPNIIRIDLNAQEAGDTLVKTPESKSSRVTVSVSSRKNTQLRRKKYPIKANLFDDAATKSSDNVNKVTTPRPDLTLLKNKFFFTESTPMLQEENAPVNTPNVKIHTDKQKSTREPHSSTTECSTPMLQETNVPVNTPKVKIYTDKQKSTRRAHSSTTECFTIPEIKVSLMPNEPHSKKQDAAAEKHVESVSPTKKYSGNLRTYSKKKTQQQKPKPIKVYSVKTDTEECASTKRKIEASTIVDVDVKKEQCDGKPRKLSFNLAKKPKILAGCSASSKTRKAEVVKPASSLEKIKKNLWFDIPPEENSVVNILDENIDAIENSSKKTVSKTPSSTRKQHNPKMESTSRGTSDKNIENVTKKTGASRIRSKLEKEVEVDSSSSDSDYQNDNFKSVDKSNLLKGKIKSSTKVRSQETDSSISTASTTSSTTSVKSVRKSSRNRIL